MEGRNTNKQTNTAQAPEQTEQHDEETLLGNTY